MSEQTPPAELDEDALYERLNQFLMVYGTDRSLLCVSELDGYFTAIGCALTPLSPEAWLPGIWGTQSDQPNWTSEEEEEEYLALTLLMYANTMATLVQGELQPVFLEQDVDGEAELVVEEWCVGFLRGAKLSGLTRQGDKTFLDEVLAPVRLFGCEAGWKKLDKMSQPEVAFWRDLIAPSVMRLAKQNHPEIEISGPSLGDVSHTIH